MSTSSPVPPSVVHRARLYANMLIGDHGLIRAIYMNRHAVDDWMIRSAPPLPGTTKKLAEKGIRRIINLRGTGNYSTYHLESEACRKYGLNLENFRIRSREPPDKKRIQKAIQLFKILEYPALIHCKSGADRTGLMSVLYLFTHRKVPLENALDQLSPRYGHLRHTKTGVLDHFFETYLAHARTRGRTDVASFLEWVDTVYTPEEIKQTFHASRLATLLSSKILCRE